MKHLQIELKMLSYKVRMVYFISFPTFRSKNKEKTSTKEKKRTCHQSHFHIYGNKKKQIWTQHKVAYHINVTLAFHVSFFFFLQKQI